MSHNELNEIRLLKIVTSQQQRRRQETAKKWAEIILGNKLIGYCCVICISYDISAPSRSHLHSCRQHSLCQYWVQIRKAFSKSTKAERIGKRSGVWIYYKYYSWPQRLGGLLHIFNLGPYTQERNVLVLSAQ